MSTRKYVPITAAEMTDFLAQYGITEDEAFAGERIFSHKYDTGKVLLIYSSLPINSDVVRERGADAIRIVVRNDKTGNHRKAGKVLRINGWRHNLETKIFEAIRKFDLHNTPRCMECGDTEVNGQTDDGEDVCAYHQLVVPKPRIIVSQAGVVWDVVKQDYNSCRVAAFNWSY